ncbi:Sec-independent protein translocase protein TatB [Camelimonas sp. ID_303_24]
MFDIGWSELLLIGGVALVVIGPKDLPRALRTLGQTTTKVKRMAADFQRQFNDAMREADMEEFRKGVSDVVDTARDLKNNFNPIDRLRSEIKGAIDDSGAPKPLPTTDVPSAGDYLASLPQPPAPDAAGKAFAAEGASPKAVAQPGAMPVDAAQATGAPPARRKRVAKVKAPENVEGIAEEGAAAGGSAAKPARASRKSGSRGAKAHALPVDTHPVPAAPETPGAAPKRSRAGKVAAADAEPSATAPKKSASRKKATPAADDASVVAPAPGGDASQAAAPADVITPANKPASDGTS